MAGSTADDLTCPPQGDDAILRWAVVSHLQEHFAKYPNVKLTEYASYSDEPEPSEMLSFRRNEWHQFYFIHVANKGVSLTDSLGNMVRYEYENPAFPDNILDDIDKCLGNSE